MKVAELVIPSGPGHVRTARLLAASVARQAGFDDDRVDDVRLAVSEACLLHLGHRQPIHVHFTIDDDALTIAVGPQALPTVMEPESQLALTLLRGLVPDFGSGDDGLSLTWPLAA